MIALLNNVAKQSRVKIIFWVCLISFTTLSCKDEFLKESPISALSEGNVLNSVDGFEFLITGLHEMAREELSSIDLLFYFDQNTGTDVVTSGQLSVKQFVNYETYLTPATSASEVYWKWAYTGLISRTNAIIAAARNEKYKDIWDSEEQKNAIIAEASFFRAYIFNILANLYGGVPIVDTVFTSPKTDFIRNTRQEVYDFARKDLEFAVQWLPEKVSSDQQGRIVKGAAYHLLTEVYINLGEYEKAIESASQVINSGTFKLMTERFGVNKSKPGDVFSDLFLEGNQNYGDGNLETIWAWQYKEFTPGGGGTGLTSKGNHLVRGWLPFWSQLLDPNGKSGMEMNDSIGRGVAIMRPTTYFLYDLWSGDWNDMRNSEFNIRREFYYNNPNSAYFGQKVEPRTTEIDTMQRLYPVIRKVEGKPWQGDVNSGRTGKDFIIYRLGETYLLRAEAYLRNGDLVKAAEDINTIRRRANGTPVLPSDVDIDYILDERARELIAEEPRRRTLMRMGKLVERVKKYNMKADTRNSISDKHELFPIPQTAIDANFTSKLEQNPGY